MSAKRNKQYNLFDEEFENESSVNPKKAEETVMLNELQVSKNDTKKVSKLKHLISSRLKKIEKLKSLLEKDKDSLTKIKTLYHKHMSEDINELCQDIEQYTSKLIKRYKQKSFTMTQRETLEYLIEQNFNELMFNDHSSETLGALIEEYNQLKEEYYGFDDEDEKFEDEFDEDLEDDFDDEIDDEFGKAFADHFGKEIVMQMFEDMGLDVGPDFFKDLNPSDPDFAAKFKERISEFAEQHKTDQETEEKRQKTLTTDKEFTKLYKSLVKKVHPDLSTDLEEKNRREELMKELSTVWDNRDYYQLLILQSKIDPDSNGGLELSDKHLQLIANDLLENMTDLEQERFNFKKNPENDFFFSNFYARSEKKIKSHLEKYKQKTEKEKNEIAENILKLKTQKTTKVFLKSVDEELNELNFFDFF